MSTFILLKIKVLKTLLMCKDTSKKPNSKERMLFSLPEIVSDKEIRVDFNAPDISSNGGLLLAGGMKNTLAWKIGSLIPDSRKREFVHHTYMEMVCQRVGQILCGYEDANDCDRLRGDSALKISCGRKPSDEALCSQPTMTRLENNVGSRTLYKIGKLFLDEYISSFDKAPKKVVIDADDTNANTYGGQQLTLFNAYYNEYCYMPLMLFDGLTGKLMLPLLRPGRRNKSQNVARIMARVVEYLHSRWPQTVMELRGDSHFCSHEFMEWAHDKWYVRYLTGLSGNSVLLAMVDKPRRRAEHDYKKKAEAQKRDNEAKRAAGRVDIDRERIVIRRYFKLEYKAASWKRSQRVIAKIEVSAEGTNIRFVVTKNRNNSAETTYRRYCGRGEMELWVKDLKYLKADRMSCNSYRANYFRLFLHAAAFVIAHRMKRTVFKGTEVERFTMDSIVRRIMLSAVHVVEKKTFIKISFSPHHRHLEEVVGALTRMAG
jgi:hypothetical protein